MAKTALAGYHVWWAEQVNDPDAAHACYDATDYEHMRDIFYVTLVVRQRQATERGVPCLIQDSSCDWLVLVPGDPLPPCPLYLLRGTHNIPVLALGYDIRPLRLAWERASGRRK